LWVLLAAGCKGAWLILCSFLKNRCRFFDFKIGNDKKLSQTKDGSLNLRIKRLCYFWKKQILILCVDFGQSFCWSFLLLL
jgi:hypothetical protein